MISRTVIQTIAFQSTPPARGATIINSGLGTRSCISIHAPREGGDQNHAKKKQHEGISIHAPREGGDFTSSRKLLISIRFQSTPPARGATPDICATSVCVIISIHAPREGGDSKDAQFYL